MKNQVRWLEDLKVEVSGLALERAYEEGKRDSGEWVKSTDRMPLPEQFVLVEDCGGLALAYWDECLSMDKWGPPKDGKWDGHGIWFLLGRGGASEGPRQFDYWRAAPPLPPKE